MALKTADEIDYRSYVTFIVLHVIALVIVVFGCCGAIRENVCSMWTYALMLFLVMAIDLILVVSLSNSEALDRISRGKFDDLWAQQLNGTDTMSPIQTVLHCCGRNGASDYTGANERIPDSCYANGILFSDGCLAKFVKLIKKCAHLVCVVMWCSIGFDNRNANHWRETLGESGDRRCSPLGY